MSIEQLGKEMELMAKELFCSFMSIDEEVDGILTDDDYTMKLQLPLPMFLNYGVHIEDNETMVCQHHTEYTALSNSSQGFTGDDKQEKNIADYEDVATEVDTDQSHNNNNQLQTQNYDST